MAPLKTRHRLLFAKGTAKDKLSRSFWWNLIIYAIIGSLIVLLAHAAFGSEDARRSAPALHLVADQPAPPQSLPEPPGGKPRTIREFHLNFKKGVYGHWPKNFRYSGSYKRAWIKSATRHTHSKAKARRAYNRYIHVDTCTSLYNTLNCHMRFPRLSYNWNHPADPNTKWVVRVAWCGTVAITEYYTQGKAGRTLKAVGGKAMGLCLPAFLIP